MRWMEIFRSISPTASNPRSNSQHGDGKKINNCNFILPSWSFIDVYLSYVWYFLLALSGSYLQSTQSIWNGNEYKMVISDFNFDWITTWSSKGECETFPYCNNAPVSTTNHQSLLNLKKTQSLATSSLFKPNSFNENKMEIISEFNRKTENINQNLKKNYCLLYNRGWGGVGESSTPRKRLLI